MEIKTLVNKYGNFTVYGTKRWFNQFERQVRNVTHESPLVKYIEKRGKKYSSFIDIGANYGYFSIIASHYIKDVYAYEAHPIRYGFLHWNVQGVKNVYPFMFYIGTSKDGVSTTGNPKGMVSTNRTMKLDTPIHTLDSLFAKADLGKTLVKIDVEGNEIDVLNSATKLLNSDTVDWVIEIHKFRRVTEDMVFSYFKDYKRKPISKGNKISHYLFYK